MPEWTAILTEVAIKVGKGLGRTLDEKWRFDESYTIKRKVPTAKEHLDYSTFSRLILKLYK